MQNKFISLHHRPGGVLPLFTCCLAFIVILLGAFTRLTHAGLSCPDWPHCYGFITAPHTLDQIQAAILRFPTMPVDTKKAWTEMVHRYFAGTEALLILTLAYSLIFKKKPRTKKTLLITAFLIALLGIQISLGMLTVTAKLKPVIVLSHLLIGISILATLWWIYLDLYFKGPLNLPESSFTLKPFLWIGFILIACQITLGGWVSTHYAALACVDFPYCNGKILPPLHLSLFNSDLITIHMLHRIGALILTLYLTTLSILLMRQPAFKCLGGTLLALLCLQITLGILNIILLLPVKIALFHQAIAILLLLTLITALVKNNMLTRGAA